MDSHGFPHNNKLNETSVLESWNEHIKKLGRSWKLLAFQKVPIPAVAKWWVPHQPMGISIYLMLHMPTLSIGLVLSPYFVHQQLWSGNTRKTRCLPFFTQRERNLFESSPVKCRSKKQQPLQGQGPLSANLRSPDETFMVCSGLNMKNKKKNRWEKHIGVHVDVLALRFEPIHKFYSHNFVKTSMSFPFFFPSRTKIPSHSSNTWNSRNYGKQLLPSYSSCKGFVPPRSDRQSASWSIDPSFCRGENDVGKGGSFSCL